MWLAPGHPRCNANNRIDWKCLAETNTLKLKSYHIAPGHTWLNFVFQDCLTWALSSGNNSSSSSSNKSKTKTQKQKLLSQASTKKCHLRTTKVSFRPPLFITSANLVKKIAKLKFVQKMVRSVLKLRLVWNKLQGLQILFIFAKKKPFSQLVSKTGGTDLFPVLISFMKL